MDPIIKWAGGKRGLLTEIRRRVPDEISLYVEPFVGGGAVLLDLMPERAVICDVNPELINMYAVVRAAPGDLIAHLRTHLLTEEYYFDVRSWDREENFLLKRSPVERASRFLFLNRSCFNGLWRVSSKGFFNVSWARPERLAFPDDDHIRAVSTYLRRSVEVRCTSFCETLPLAQSGTFYYLDPPYMPASIKGSFTSYSPSGFGAVDHGELASFCSMIERRSANFLLSSSDCPAARELYKEFDIGEVRMRRSVGARAATRKVVDELLVRPKSAV